MGKMSVYLKLPKKKNGPFTVFPRFQRLACEFGGALFDAILAGNHRKSLVGSHGNSPKV